MEKFCNGARITKEYRPGVIIETMEQCGNATTRICREANDMDLVQVGLKIQTKARLRQQYVTGEQPSANYHGLEIIDESENDDEEVELKYEQT